MHDLSSEARSSLLCSTDQRPVALRGVAVAGQVLGAHARVCIRQRYRNEEKRAIEAIYTFPLPSDAVLVGFAMECAGRRLESEVKEREEAFQVYDEAISKGHGGALLDQERQNVFTASVGNLLPDEETVIEIAYVQRLTADEGALRLMIPTLVAPRYIPGAPAGDRTGHGTAQPTPRVPDADRISPTIGHVSYGLSLDVVFDVGGTIDVESPSHAVTVRTDTAGRVHVGMKHEEVALDRDIVLLANRAPGEGAGIVAHRQGDEEGTFALTVVPDLFRGNRPAATDVIFLVDTSGSMAGSAIEQARSALRLCLRHLVEGDRFNIIGFDTYSSSFAPSLVPFTQRTLEEADQWIVQLHASGGTELLQPLLTATNALTDARRERVIVLLTDGQVGNEVEIASRMFDHERGPDAIRMYTFGIGTNVSDLLLRELARRSKGAVEFIHPGERIEEKVTAQFARAVAPRVDDVSLKLVGLDAGELAPGEMPPLIDGEPWVVYGRYEQPGIGHAEIRGTSFGEPFVLQIPIELPANEDRPALHALWAASRIRDLEDGEGRLSGRHVEAQKARIIKLSIAHAIGSKYTSFVVIEKRSGDRRSHGMPEARPIPVNAPAGWAGIAPVTNRVRTGTWGASVAHPLSRPSFSPAARSAPAAPGFLPSSLGAPPLPPPGLSPTSFTHVAQRSGPPDPSAPSAPTTTRRVSKPEPSEQGSIQSLFEKQLASGLWMDTGRTGEEQLLATARALLACFEAGIDTGHARFGIPLKKAIAEVRRAAKQLAQQGQGARAIAAAFAASFLVASGSRARKEILDSVHVNKMTKGLAADLTDTDAARKKLRELAVEPFAI